MGTHFKYIFFIELDGHFHDPEVQKTIAPYKDQIKWLGSYARMC
jgi:prephenate dehydratase